MTQPMIGHRSPEFREMYGRSHFGNACLLARRLVDRLRAVERLNNNVPGTNRGDTAA